MKGMSGNPDFDTYRLSEDHEAIREAVIAGRFTQHVVVNVAKLVHMRSDAQLGESVRSCDIINIDGMGVVVGARFLGHDVSERVAGVDLFHELLAMSAREGLSVYLLGAHDEVVAATAVKAQALYPGLKIAGYNHGYFWDDEAAMVEKIRASGAQLLFVAITSPKKENFINRWRDQLATHAGTARERGYDDALLRLWEFYLAYCEAAFAERYVSLVQLVLDRPGSVPTDLEVSR